MPMSLHEGRVPIVDPSAAAALGGALRREEPPSPALALGDGAARSRRTPTTEVLLSRLHVAQAEHPFWQNRLFRAASTGALTRDDYAFIFSQYHLYAQSFTRYLAALMASCEDDLLRAALSANLWEEGGQQVLEKRHAELFRRFLRDGLGVDVDRIEYLDATRFFASEYLDFCRRAHPAAASAFLSLGTEGIVPRMYGLFLDGLRKAGVGPEHTSFFQIHMECDDAHAETLERIMASYAGEPDWLATCQRAMDHALGLRARFFEQLYESVLVRRVRPLLESIQRQERGSAAPLDPSALVHRADQRGSALYHNSDERLGIEFSVERLPFATEVFDARVLRVAPRKSNERHRHPHESVFHVIQGRARVFIDSVSVEVGPGDVVFVPRWAHHRSENISDEELTILALTDFGLTERAFIGDHLSPTRRKGTQAPRAR